MSESDVDVVRRLFRAVEERDVETMYGIYAEDVTVREAACLPYGGEHHGHAGVLQHGLGYVQAWDELQTEDDRQLDADFVGAGDRVFVHWRQKAHGAGGERLDMPMVSVYRLRDGAVAESAMHAFDSAALAEFLARQGRG